MIQLSQLQPPDFHVSTQGKNLHKSRTNICIAQIFSPHFSAAFKPLICIHEILPDIGFNFHPKLYTFKRCADGY